ncbi:MAG: carbohydrate ABC transporter permease [Lachnospiraceae bacterium]|nr:carbohydrate ABC transporter permease [Lachnospiraceae bacterium]
MKATSKKNKVLISVCFLILLGICIIWIFPMIWALLTAFQSENEIQRMDFHILPVEFTFENYAKLFHNDSSPVLRWFLNSMVIALGHMGLVVVIVALAGYGFTRLQFKGRDPLFLVLMATMMFPSVMNLIPNFKIVDSLGWTNTYLAVIVPGAAGVTNVFLVRQFMLGIPKELDEAAYVDGANHWQVFRNIILPNAKPVLMVVALFSFTGAWNDFLWPSIVMRDVDMLPITPGLQLLQGQYMTYPGIAMAGAILAIIPTFILYLFAQKKFMESMSLGSGIK